MHVWFVAVVGFTWGKTLASKLLSSPPYSDDVTYCPGDSGAHNRPSQGTIHNTCPDNHEQQGALFHIQLFIISQQTDTWKHI